MLTGFVAPAASGAAVYLGLPAVMVICAALYVASAILVLGFAGGGIGRVVSDSRLEFDALAREGTVGRYGH